MPRKFILTEENYHSRAARRRWLSSSDVKAAKRCEAAWLADYCGKIKHEENKPAFAFGHLFEAALTPVPPISGRSSRAVQQPRPHQRPAACRVCRRPHHGPCRAA